MPIDYFLIEEENERRLDIDFKKWEDHYIIFQRNTRLNFLMLLSSCFERYYRSVIALSLESKPACVLGLDNEIDGAFLLKKDLRYGEYGKDYYRFNDIVDSLCKGDWQIRAKEFAHFFKQFSTSIDLVALNEFRVKRNDIAHFFARTKKKYGNPLQLNPIPLSSLSEQNY